MPNPEAIAARSAPPVIHALVAKFADHQETYQRGDYNETQLRQDFLDPFFKALGWDMNNEQGYAEAYREVIHEDALRVEKTVKAPDYGFRIGGTRKFFVEAKKPSVDIRAQVGPAFQLRRYAWTAKLPLSILTDFEELAVYDCRIKPDKTDNAAKARIKIIRFDEYVDRWDEIAGIFSREAILKGSFDKFAESAKKKRGTAEVDEAFLEEIESWRESLAKNISLRNEVSDRELNFAVQLIIDRIIFLRMCEGRGIEPYDRLNSVANGQGVYGRLVELFHRADEKYNSGLFHFSKEKGRAEKPDRFTTCLTIDDKILRDIIRRLYYPESPYEFAALPADILGQVYEQFLGKVIVRTPPGGRGSRRAAALDPPGGRGSRRAATLDDASTARLEPRPPRVRIEDKPEVKKAGGVYYTPTYIVDYIVENTVGKLLEGKTPQEVGGLTATWKPAKNGRPLSVLDPACGSGSFLIVAYQYLLDWYLRQYIEVDKPDQHARGKAPRIYQNAKGDWRLTGGERKRILLSHIYGVDIDYQAVEVTKLSLLLKVLEGETEESLQRQARLFHKERALPDLSNNIKCGNSLIGPDFYDLQQLEMFNDDERERINVFDWSAQFPPIVVPRGGGFDAVIGNPPYDVLEKNRGSASWPHEALLAYVRKTPALAEALGGKLNLFRFFAIRSLCLTKRGGRFGMIMPLALLGDISCAATRRAIFHRAADATIECFPQKDNVARRVFRNAKLSTAIVCCTHTSSIDDPVVRVRTYPWNSFGDSPKDCVIKWSDAALLDPKHVPLPLLDEKNWRLCKRIYQKKGVQRLGDVPGVSVTRGEINQTIFREFISESPKHVRLLKGVEIGRFRLNDKLSQGKREWFDEERFLQSNSNRSMVELERIATQRITGVDEKWRVVAARTRPRAYFADSTNSVVLQEYAPCGLSFILALLNSRFVQWRFKLTSTNNNVGTNELEAIPVLMNDTSHSIDECAVRLESLWERLRAANSQPAKAAVQREVENWERRVDQLVYELYGLTDKEIAIVEDATRND